MVASFGVLLVLAAASPGYVGAKACRGCHGEIHARWDASRHSKMVRPASPEGVRGDFSVKEVTLRDVTYRFEAKDGKYFITESKLLGKKTRHRILYTLGNRRIQHYLTRLDDGRIVVLPPSWDVLRKEWFHNMEIVGPEPPKGMAVQVWNLNCFGCHVSQEERNFDIETRTYDTDWVDFGTSCERCHGPGRDHVSLYTDARGPQADAQDSAIVVQTRLDPARSTMVCGQCHSLRDAISLDFVAGANYFDFFLPQLEYGLPQDHDPAWYLDGSTRRFSNDTLGLWMSRCFLEGGVTCVDCHIDPHDTEIEKNQKIRPEASAICTRCHEAIGMNVPAHTRHAETSAGSSCVECHMPRNVLSIKAKIRDHGISLPAPENTERHGIPNACNNCHQDRTPAWAAAAIDEWFPGSQLRRQKLLDRADIFSRAKGNDPEVVERLVALAANESEPPLIRANAVGYLGSFASDPRVQPALLRAFGSKEPLIRAIAMPQIGKLKPSRVESVTPFLVRALDDEVATVRMGAAFALMSLGVRSLEGDAGVKFDAAKQIYAGRAATSPDHAPTQLALGKFHVLNHDLASAAVAFEASLRLDPGQEDAVYYRALVRLGEGRKDEAKELLQKVEKESSFYAAAMALLQTLSQP